MKIPRSRQVCPSVETEDIRIMTQGLVGVLHGRPCPIKRGMTVICGSGEVLGRVAALVFHRKEGRIIYVILGHLPQEGGYQAFPVAWIDQICKETVILNVSADLVIGLPNWHSE